jgi:hypothetical protein
MRVFHELHASTNLKNASMLLSLLSFQRNCQSSSHLTLFDIYNITYQKKKKKKKDVMRVFHELHASSKLEKCLNATFIALLSKKLPKF